jgi:hypothetical protein
MTILKLFLIGVLSGSLFGQSATEKTLQEQLNAANAALAAEKEDRAELIAQVANARAAAIAQTAAMVLAKKDPQAVQNNAAVLAASDAATAQLIAQANGAAARKSAEDAAVAAQNAANTARGQNIALMITQSFGFLAVLAGLLWKGYTEARDRRWALEDQRAQWRDRRLGTRRWSSEFSESTLDRQAQRVECLSGAVIDVETTGLRIVRDHQHQERPFGEVQPTGDSRLGPLGKSQDRLILVQSLQSKILQTQDVIDFYCVHTDLHVVWLIVDRVQILLTRH